MPVSRMIKPLLTVVAGLHVCTATRHLRSVGQHAGTRGSLGMRPDITARLLGEVEDSWVNSSLAVISGTEQEDTSMSTMVTSCSKVVRSLIDGSAGDNTKVSEYMVDVCARSHEEGHSEELCKAFSSHLATALTGDEAFNRQDLDPHNFCQEFYKGSVNSAAKAEAKRLEEEAQEREKRRIEEEKAAEAKRLEEEKRRAEEAKEEAQKLQEEEAQKQAQRAEEEAKQQAEKQKEEEAAAAAAKANATKSNLGANNSTPTAVANATAEALAVADSLASGNLDANSTTGTTKADDSSAVKINNVTVTVKETAVVDSAANSTVKLAVHNVTSVNTTAKDSHKSIVTKDLGKTHHSHSA